MVVVPHAHTPSAAHYHPPLFLRLPSPRLQVCVECVGYLLEELRNPETLEEMRKDVETANIFIGSLIFIQVGVGVGGICFCLCVV